MAHNTGLCLYREARLNIEPAFPGSTVAFTLPSNPLSTFGSRPAAKRTLFLEQPVDQDEDAFARRHLATDGSLFFRRHHSYPRSFLWRVLDNRNVLEIQAVDLDHDVEHQSEANLTLLLNFPSPIRPFCIALAEPEDQDALLVYAVTTANELYTLTLHRDFFSQTAASEQDMEQWCKRSEPALFSGRIPYRMVAVEADKLLVTLDDGAICRLCWDKSDNIWDGSRYSQSNWSVRGLLSWKAQPTVRFENAQLSVSAAAAVALSPDSQHIFSVSLDHTLRAWNIASGKPGASTDLLGLDDHAVEKVPTSYSIGPSQSSLLAVVDVPGGVGGAQYHVVTYSPKLHHFKFWGVRDADDAQAGLYDAAVGAELVPPIDELMNTTVWTLEEFHIIPGPSGWMRSTIWIRARSGPSSRVYKLDFDLTDDADTLSQSWRNDWISVDAGSLTVDSLKQNPANPASHGPQMMQDMLDSTEEWLAFLFYPGRFTDATLETALTILSRRLHHSQPSRTSNRASLKERLCAAIISLASSSEDAADSSIHAGDNVAAQWQAYYGLVKDLHKRRGDSLRLVYDSDTSMPWLVLSDSVSTIRACSSLEISTMNPTLQSRSRRSGKPARNTLESPESRGVAQLLNAAASFRQRLPLSVQQEVEKNFEMDMLQSRSLTIIDRMETIEGQCEVSQHVSDDDLSLLVEELGTEVKNLRTDTFLRAIKTLGQKADGKLASRRQIARYGLSALLRVSQESVQSVHGCLLDLLVLVLFMSVELEGETLDHFDPSKVFVELISQYKECMVVSWLVSRVWGHQAPTGPASEHLDGELSKNLKLGSTLPFTQTVMEGVFGHTTCHVSLPKDAQADLLTIWSRGWIVSIFENGYEQVVEDVMGILIYQKEYDLASGFSKFLPESNWASYLKGRLHLQTGDMALASVYLQRPAYNFGLGAMFNVELSDTANLVPETERTFFSEGLSRYYTHVTGLFERARAFSYVADFARLGLRSLPGGEDEELHTELLQRLFTASVHTARFTEAYSAMSRLHDVALQRSNLQNLLTAMLAARAAHEFISLPFPPHLAETVDSAFAAQASKILNLSTGLPYHQILYSWRIKRGDFRGAASVMYERLQRLKGKSGSDAVRCYLMVVNALECVGKEDAWILAERPGVMVGGGSGGFAIGQGKKALKRSIVTLDSLRKELSEEMDCMDAVEQGRFPFVDPGEDMDIL